MLITLSTLKTCGQEKSIKDKVLTAIGSVRIVLRLIIYQDDTLLNRNLNVSQVLLTPDKVRGDGSQISRLGLSIIHAFLNELVVSDFVFDLVANVRDALDQFLGFLEFRVLVVRTIRFGETLIGRGLLKDPVSSLVAECILITVLHRLEALVIGRLVRGALQSVFRTVASRFFLF